MFYDLNVIFLELGPAVIGRHVIVPSALLLLFYCV